MEKRKAKTCPFSLSLIFEVTHLFKGAENNLEYAFVSYDMRMKMTFNNQEFDDESKEMMTSMMKAQGMDITFISNSTMDVLLKDSLTIMLKEDAVLQYCTVFSFWCADRVEIYKRSSIIECTFNTVIENIENYVKENVKPLKVKPQKSKTKYLYG